jgi:tetratricopeptide (TPR) repeat protein
MLKYFLLSLCILVVVQGHAQDINKLLKNAETLAADKQYTEALAVYQQLYKKDSSNYDIILGRAAVYTAMEKYNEGFVGFTRLVTLYPDSAAGYFWRGQILYVAMESDGSIEEYTKALDRVKEDTIRMKCFMNRGSARLQKRDFQGAYEDFTRASLITPNDIGVINNIATVLDELGRIDEAIAQLKRLIQLDPKFIGGYVNLGFQYTKQKKYREAIGYFDKALEIDKNEPLTLNNRGLARYYINDLEGAMADINKSLSIYKENSYAYKNRALVYLAQKNKDKACSDLRTALEYGFEHMYGEEVSELIKQHCK